MGRLIGVFGGTFDPPHLGHAILAHEARLGLKLDSVLWIVTGDPPHKPNRKISPAAQRLAMIEMMTADESAFALSRVELDRQPPHYAVDTLELLREQYPRDELIYLMGSDSLMELSSVWHNPQQFVNEVDQIGVMHRVNAEVNLDQLAAELPGIESKVRLFQAPLIEISSSLIRQRAAEGLPYQHFLTEAVGQYVSTNRLYTAE